MVNAILYYRTPSTLSDTAGATTPELMLANHPTQSLSFNFPDNILEGVKLTYVNNVTNIPAPNSDGIKRVNKQENGMRSMSIVINGVFKNVVNTPVVNADIQKLTSFASQKQIDGKHVHGIIGFYSPNAPNLSLDPNATTGALPAGKATVGYTLETFSLGHIGQKITRYDFQVTLSFGGIFTG